MTKKKLYIAYDTIEQAEAAMNLLGRRADAGWHDRIETAQVSPTYTGDIPELEDFEDLTSDWNFILAPAAQDDGDTSTSGTTQNPFRFFRNKDTDGMTPSGNTGPLQGFDGTFGYVFTEASTDSTPQGSHSPNKYFAMERDILAGTGVSKMRFYYHMHGAAMDYQNNSYFNEKAYLSVEVSVDAGTNWVPLPIIKDLGGTGEATVARLDGQQQTAQSLPFLQAEVDLSSIGNSAFKIRFFAKTADIGTDDSDTGSWKSDMAVDEITFHRAPPETKYLVDTKNGEGYDILFAEWLTQTWKGGYAALKEAFIQMEIEISEEEKAINDWTSTQFLNEPKKSLRKATKEYLNRRTEEAGNQNKTSDYHLKRQEYLDLGGSLLPDE